MQQDTAMSAEWLCVRNRMGSRVELDTNSGLGYTHYRPNLDLTVDRL